MSGLLVQARAAFRENVVFKFDMVIRILLSAITLAVAWQLWSSLSRSGFAVPGMTELDLITYAMLSTLLGTILPTGMGFLLSDRVRSGDIAREFLRPTDLVTTYLGRSLGVSVSQFATRLAPLVVLSLLFLPARWPSSPDVWSATVCSLVLAYLLAFAIHFLVGLSSFVLTEVWGIEYIKASIILFCSGGVVPLAAFPGGLRTLVDWLPFRGIYAIPLTIMVETGWHVGLAKLLAFQLIWCLVLYGCLALAVRSLHRLLMIAGG